MEKKLYHYTATFHLPKIMKDRYLKLTESNLRYPETMYKPVVWMTTDGDCHSAFTHGLSGSSVDKTEVKITIQCQKHYKYWKVWSRQNKIDKELAAFLEAGRNPNSWWISEKPISFNEIIQIENTKTGEIYYRNEVLKIAG